MGKFNKFLKAVSLILKKPALLNNVLNDNNVWKNYVKRNYNLQAGLPVVNINELFPDFSETVKLFGFLDGSSLPTDIALLTKLATQIKDCKFFEIGTWRGETIVNVASVAKECYTLNLPEEEMKKSGLTEDYINQHAFFSKNILNIIHLKGNSKTYDFAGLNKKFDLIFIDGDHHYDLVKNDTKKVFEFLTHDNSIVVWHDYAYNPETIRYEVLAGILDGTSLEIHKNIYHVSNTLSAVFMNKKLEGKTLETPAKPDKYFEVSLKMKKIKKVL